MVVLTQMNHNMLNQNLRYQHFKKTKCQFEKKQRMMPVRKRVTTKRLSEEEILGKILILPFAVKIYPAAGPGRQGATQS